MELIAGGKDDEFAVTTDDGFVGVLGGFEDRRGTGEGGRDRREIEGGIRGVILNRINRRTGRCDQL